jgi:alpha-methylacyl-CoA racemase
MPANAPSTPPLAGIRVIEFAGLGPAPYACMLLADLGADVLRIARPDAAELFPVKDAPVDRGRRHLALDLKQPESIELCLRLAEKADVVIEGFRPGVMERLGLGPDTALARNPKLIYGRMTGWGQDGPLASAAGHDLTFLALTGALEAIGPADGPPVPPLNLVGDMGGGGVFLVIGILSALLERQKSGLGQVVDAAILDGVASQLVLILGLKAGGLWSGARGRNLLDGGVPFYRTYACADDKYIAVGALETKFFATLVQGLGLDASTLVPKQWDQSTWPALQQTLAETFGAKPRDEWAALFAKTDACVTPVLNFEEAARHPHNAARGTYLQSDGRLEPAPAPRFSRSKPKVPGQVGEGSENVLKEWGVEPAGR